MFGTLFRIALPLVAQQGLKATFASLRRQAVVLLAAAALLATGAAFALVAIHALLLENGFGPPAAAGLIAAVLIGFALLMLAINTYRNTRSSRSGRAPRSDRDGDGPLYTLDEQAGRLMQNVGPLTLLAAAFAIGLAAGRRK